MIVGGDLVESVLANRLSEDPGTTVLVLEAGRSDWRLRPVHPHAGGARPSRSAAASTIGSTASEPEPFMGGRRVSPTRRGKVLGGSSSINGMIFQRGNPLEYERWASLLPGMATWDHAHCLPYFKPLDGIHRLAAAADYLVVRPMVGLLALERGPATSPLFLAWFEAAQEVGYPLTDYVGKNGYQQQGLHRSTGSIRHGRRISAARAYRTPSCAAAT